MVAGCSGVQLKVRMHHMVQTGLQSNLFYIIQHIFLKIFFAVSTGQWASDRLTDFYSLLQSCNTIVYKNAHIS